MLKRFAAVLTAGTAILAATSFASAADMAVKAPPAPAQVYEQQVLVNSWTGFYIGANVGYAWADSSVSSFSSNLNGVIGGGQLGYNWQTGPLLIGIEGDFQGSSQSQSDSGFVGAVPFTLERRIPWFATLRGRIGYVTGPMLFYFTGGGAWLDNSLSVSSGGATVSDSATTTAWTVGGGLEWMFAPKWSAKLEYLHLAGRERSVTLLDTTFSGRARDNIVRVGVNYHF